MLHYLIPPLNCQNMLEKLNLKDLPVWVIVTFSGVIAALFSLLLTAQSDLRKAEAAKERAVAECEAMMRKKVETELAEWKASFAAMKADQEAKLKQLEKIKKR